MRGTFASDSKRGRTGPRSRRLLAAISSFGVVAIGVGLLASERTLRSLDEDDPTSASRAAAESLSDERAAASGDWSEVETIPFGHAIRTALDSYRQFSVYPPWSRPAGPATEHISNWNADQTQSVDLEPLGLAGVSVEAEVDRYFLGPGDSVHVRIALRIRDSDRIVAPDALALVTSLDIAASAEPSLPMRWKTVRTREPTHQPGSQQAEWATEYTQRDVALASREANEARIVVTLRSGEKVQELWFPLELARAAPVEVLALGGDRIVDGSLEVALDANVARPGRIQLRAVLLDRMSRPIAIADRAVGYVAAGRQTLTLTFFGRAIRERGVDGPYRVASVHGWLQTDDEHASNLVWWAPPGFEEATRGHRAMEFSGDEWDAPEKRAKIKLYEALLVDSGSPTGSHTPSEDRR